MSLASETWRALPRPSPTASGRSPPSPERRVPKCSRISPRDRAPRPPSARPRKPSAPRLLARALPAQPANQVRRRDDTALVDLTVAEREHLQQRERFLRLLVGSDVLHDRLGFTVLRDDERFAVLGEVANHVGGVRLEIGDRLDLSR